MRHLGSWLSAAEPDRSNVPWTDVAIAVYVYVEGWLFLESVLRSDPTEPWSSVQAQRTSETASTLVLELSEMVAGPDAPIALASEAIGPGYSPAQSRILEALADRSIASRAGGDLARLVDLEVLADSLAVSSRRLHAVWPTAADFNLDVATASLMVLRARVDDLTLRTFVAATAGYDKFVGLFESTFQAILGGSGVAARVWFGCSSSFDDQHVRQAVASLLDDWYEAQRVALFAALQVIGHRLRKPGDGGRYVEAVFATVNGALRLSTLHPALLDRTVTYNGQTRGSLPTAIDAMFRSFTEHWDGEPVADGPATTWAPPLPDLPDVAGSS